ncbi:MULTISPECIES: cell division topological specificity factor MinE [unclassified Photobacterium]|uniref:cell division topological specificity factor MinE n=1 Tax=unclassified Photobacterium TaxID=2628852 RepID=UPI001EDFDCBB|nr:MULTISPECIES: cell division topological specificity factor MinE [unclassified Photobacterium]MCG3865305.1 cell division topological specificity factor MinE [Photobacterium sp. Ph6]MCG3876873.1 cell division topological specificity factor MinE [Photobacterium sp. Ph5]
MFNLWKKKQIDRPVLGSASVAKQRLLGELRTNRIPYNVQMMKDELSRLLSQWADIKDNKIEIVKTSKSTSILKIKCRCS